MFRPAVWTDIGRLQSATSDTESSIRTFRSRTSAVNDIVERDNHFLEWVSGKDFFVETCRQMVFDKLRHQEAKLMQVTRILDFHNTSGWWILEWPF